MEKIVYKTDGNNIIGWVDRLIDTKKYQLKENELFGDEFKKPILSDGVIIEGWVESEAVVDLKKDKIKQLKENADVKFSINSKWYQRYNRQTISKSRGNSSRKVEEVPQDIIDIDDAIEYLVDLKESEINDITDYQELIDYDITL